MATRSVTHNRRLGGSSPGHEDLEQDQKGPRTLPGDFHAEAYHDTYRERLEEAIAGKIEDGT